MLNAKKPQGTHTKLNDDSTGKGENLDQILYFGLMDQIAEIAQQRADEFKKYGVTQEDVLNEIRQILRESNKCILSENH
jgi:uncharacterized protein (DUF885 family)